MRARVAALERSLEALAAGLADAAAFLPRLFVVEDEYRRAVLAAELGYVRALTDDIAAGRLRW